MKYLIATLIVLLNIPQFLSQEWTQFGSEINTDEEADIFAQVLSYSGDGN
jgi:hypothetical protein